MTNIVALIGSLRKESINRAVFNHYRELTQELFSMTEGEIEAIPLYNQDISSEPDSVAALAQQVASSDGIIFFSPEYNYSMPGVLKNTLDWLSRSDLKPCDNKPAAIIGASPGPVGTARMQYHLRQVGVFLNLRFLNKPEAMIGQCMQKIDDGRISDEDTVAFLHRHAQAFSTHVKGEAS